MDDGVMGGWGWSWETYLRVGDVVTLLGVGAVGNSDVGGDDNGDGGASGGAAAMSVLNWVRVR